MSRWNGWGEESTIYELPESAIKYLQKLLGLGKAPRDVALEMIVEKVPQSKLPSHQLISTDPKERVFHSFGQSLGDWIGIRSGNVSFFPDGIAYPKSTIEVEEVVKLAKEWNAIIIPYGGGTSVVGHINVIETTRPVITMSMSRMNKLLSISKKDMLATFQGNETMDIPNKVNCIVGKDIPIMIERALKEANPLYPVPKILNKDDLFKLYHLIKE